MNSRYGSAIRVTRGTHGYEIVQVVARGALGATAMASSDCVSEPRKSRLRLAVLILLALAAGATAGRSVWSFVRHEGSYLAVESDKRTLHRKWIQVRDAQEHLEHLGAQFPGSKGLVFNEIDLTHWHGDDEGLEYLQSFVFLEELGVVYDYTLGANRQWLTITADDTRLTDAAVPFLVRLRNLRRLEIRGTQFSNEGVRRLREALPLCTIVQ